MDIKFRGVDQGLQYRDSTTTFRPLKRLHLRVIKLIFLGQKIYIYIKIQN